MRLPVLTAGNRGPAPEGEPLVATLPTLLAEGRIVPADVELAPLVSSLLGELKLRTELDLDATGESVAFLARLLTAKSAELVAQPTEADDEEASSGRRDPDPQAADILALARVLSAGQGRETFAGPSLLLEIPKPTAPRSAVILVRAWQEMEQASEQRDTHVSVPAFVRLETALSNLVRRLKTRATESVGRLLAGRSRNDAVVHFLALLELIRTDKVAAHQDEPFEDIRVEWAEDSEEREVRAG